MKTIRIIHWDDDPKVKAFLDSDIPKALNNYSISVDEALFFIDKDQFLRSLDSGQFDLIILDIHTHENPEAGLELLTDIIRDYKSSIPVLIYTWCDNYIDKVNYFKTKHDLKIKLLPKKLKSSGDFADELNSCLIELLNLKPKLPEFTHHNDINTLHTISKIGLTNISGIISELIRISDKNELSKKVKCVKAITPGYSGAYILVVEFETYSKIFKISNNFEQIIKEYNNLTEFSQQLKSSIKVDFERIEPDKLHFNGWYAIVYEFIPYLTDLFSWLSEIRDIKKEQEIIEVLEKIFSDDGLPSLNKLSLEKELPLNENILLDMDSSRVAYINSTINELDAILKCNNFETCCNKAKFLDLILEQHTFGYISSSKIEKPSSIQYLSHNDLHANNILLDKWNQPKIIDPGNVSMKHWSSDISRLLVDLIIRGLDKKCIEYFKLETIEKWLLPIITFVKGKDGDIEIPKNDVNTGFLIAIRWLLRNVKNIYSGGIYEEWEFQLGLAVEFLKASYKSLSLPPGKRVLSLLLACEAIKIAEENLKNKLNNKK